MTPGGEVTASDEEKLDAWAARQRREKEWLASLKVGSKVAVYRGYGNRTPEVATVTGETSRYLTIGKHGERFRKDTGRKVGGSKWHSSWIKELTPEIELAAEHKALAERLAYTKWPTLSLEALRAVAATLDISQTKKVQHDEG